MFGTKHNEIVGFESRWKVTKVISEGSTQTKPSSSSETSTNTTVQRNTETQTSEVESENENANFDMQKLANWLQQVYPLMKTELDEASNSQAFKGYKLHDESEDATCTSLQKLDLYKSVERIDKTSNISSISWSSTGKNLAVSSKFEHKNWCYHTGIVLIYSLTRDEKLCDSPKMKFPTETCVTSLKFHPKNASTLAGGLYSGAVIIWNIHNDENNVVGTRSVHEGTITQVSWISDIDMAKTVLLATSGTDGLLKLWNFGLNNSTLSLKARYMVKSPLLAGNTKKEEGKRNVFNKVTRSVVRFSFSKHVPEMFVVALEGGLIVQCSVLGTSMLKGHTEQEPLLDPVFKYYESHKGEVRSITFSPNRSEMFMTYGTDSEVRIYLIGQEEPAQVIFPRKPLQDLSFVPYEEKLIVGCGSEGILEIFNVITGKAIQNVVKEKVSKRNLTRLAINPWRTGRIAVGNSEGELELWDVPWRLFSKSN